MRCEAEVRARLSAGEHELRVLGQEINKLSMQVKVGDEGWRTALETLSTCIEQRRTLYVQLDSLRWVLAAEAERLAG